MKKVMLIFGMSLFSYAMFAQTTFGAKAGVNLANLHGDIEDNSMLTKLNFGGYVNFQIGEKFQIQPELLYQGMGTKLEVNNSYTSGGITYSEKGDATIKMDYLTIPIMAKYYFVNGFYGEFGPQLGFALSQKIDYDYTIESGGASTSEKASGDLDKVYEGTESFDIALGFGLGYQLDSGLNFGARYNLGLNSVIEQKNPDFKASNGVIMIGVGYTFNYGGNQDEE